MFDIPISGTHAHSWVMNFKDEYTAFKAYSEVYPENTLLLVDTYDTLKQGVPNAIKVFKELKEKGYKPKGIRLDSGDLAYLSKKARQMLDDAGFPDTIICASGDLDEYSITSLKNQGAEINVWGVGTKLITSADMPALGGVYKLSAVIENGEIIPKIKVSNNSEKITNPGFKNFYRIYDNKTKKAKADVIYLRDEPLPDGSEPLTITHPKDRWKKMTYTDYTVREMQITVIKNGKLVYDLPDIKEIKAYAEQELDTLWDEYKRIDNPHLFKVDLSDKLYELKTGMLEKLRNR
jgi:nicotinate phosphoribosyltransferase